MTFAAQTTLTGYARTAVDLKTRMDAYCTSIGGRQYLEAFARQFHDNAYPDQGPTEDLITVVHRLASIAWRIGEPYVLAPAMTAIVAAAADALDLTGDTLHADVAPSDYGVLFLPIRSTAATDTAMSPPPPPSPGRNCPPRTATAPGPSQGGPHRMTQATPHPDASAEPCGATRSFAATSARTCWTRWTTCPSPARFKLV
jgi:hypothetical protein